MLKNQLKYFIVIFLFLFPVSLTGKETVTLKVFCWNIHGFTDMEGFPLSLDKYAEKVKAKDVDIFVSNEFATAYQEDGHREKMAEFASKLGMYCYFVESYPKSEGYYGNVILSKYPIVSAGSELHPYKHAKGPGNYQWNSNEMTALWGADQRSVGYIDIAVPCSKGTQIVRIGCSHFDHMGKEAVRTRQADVAVDFLRLENPVYPTIFMGDLNTGSEMTLQRLYDLGTIVKNTWVDYIFVYPKTDIWHIVSSETVSAGGLSDHDAIFAELQLDI